MMNYYSYSAFKRVCDHLKDTIVGCRINHISVVNSSDIILTLSMVKNERLLISLNHHHPFITLLNIKHHEATLAGTLLENLKKYLKDAFIVSLQLKKDDRIISFVLQKANEYYEKEKFNLILEFISQRANLVITDQNNVVLFALHYCPLTNQRPLLKNMIYEYPQTVNVIEEEAPSIEEIKENGLKYYQLALNKHKKEKYQPLYTFLKGRIKAIVRKIEKLKLEIIEAKKHFDDVNHGNFLLMNKEQDTEIDAYINDNHLFLDKTKTIIENANMFFKKYKKSKRTVEIASIEINKAENEKDYLNYILATSSYMSDEELTSLLFEFKPQVIKNKKKISPIKYGSIDYLDSKIFFGKNAASNNELTFHIAQKSDTYLHIKDYHGSHVIIRSPSLKKEVQLFAAEICLILSNKKEGEVMITPIKNVKKGKTLGEAILLNYQTIIVHQVRQSSIDEFNSLMSK